MDSLSPDASVISPPTQAEPSIDRPGLPWRLHELVELLLYPETFFKERIDAVGAWMTASQALLLMYLLGVDKALDESRTMKTFASNAAPASALFGSVAFDVLCVAPLFFGPIMYYVGGFSYRLRLRFAGGTPDGARARAAFAVISLARVVAALPMRAALAATYPSRFMLLWLSITVLAWACYVEYTSARVAFGASRVRALIWLVFVPAAAMGFLLFATFKW